MDIFAGSLPFKLKEEDLKKLFEPFGEVTSATIIVDKITRQNKGFGFIVMPNDDEAKAAIEALNGSEVMGRQIVVNESDKDRKSGPKNTERKNFSNNSNSNFRKDGPYQQKQGGFNNKNKGFNRDRRDKYRGDDSSY
ncbi:MAG TPA: hypothetical protein VNB90_14030 [Cytophagaceae bacterium]|jgi:RNA recognition motif-containing protein|nr:hypothetical protein [Cytophagaceae bacterium]